MRQSCQVRVYLHPIPVVLVLEVAYPQFTLPELVDTKAIGNGIENENASEEIVKGNVSGKRGKETVIGIAIALLLRSTLVLVVLSNGIDGIGRVIEKRE